MSCNVCQKDGTGKQNLEVGVALQHAGVCDCI